MLHFLLNFVILESNYGWLGGQRLKKKNIFVHHEQRIKVKTWSRAFEDVWKQGQASKAFLTLQILWNVFHLLTKRVPCLPWSIYETWPAECRQWCKTISNLWRKYISNVCLELNVLTASTVSLFWKVFVKSGQSGFWLWAPNPSFVLLIWEKDIWQLRLRILEPLIDSEGKFH